MTLTKEEAIRRHRMMWEWIANETLKRRRCVRKETAFYHFGWDFQGNILLCWCCEYSGFYCDLCPIKWPGGSKEYATCIIRDTDNGDTDLGLYFRWSNAVRSNDWRTAAYYALYISMLPERK